MTEYHDPFADPRVTRPLPPKKSNRLFFWGVIGCFGFLAIFFAVVCVAGYLGYKFVHSRQLAEQGAVEYEKGNHEKAVRHFDQALEIDPKYQDALVLRAESRRSLGDYEKALEDCNRLIELNPDHEGVYNIRGLVHDAMGDSQKALADFLKAVEQNAEPLSLSNVALTYNDLEDYDKALEYINLAVAKSPQNAYFNYNRGVILYDKEDYESALADFELCLKRKRPIESFGATVTLEEIAEYYTNCLTNSEKHDQLEQFERQAVEDDPLNVERYRELRYTYFLQGKYDEADKLLDKALSLIKDEDDRDSLYSSWAYSYAFDDVQIKQRAVEIARKYVAETSANINSLKLLASIYWYLDQWEEAVSVYTQLIEDDPQYLSDRAGCYHEMKEYEKALADFDKLEQSGEPLDSDFYYERAITFAAMENFEKAEESITKCIETAHEEGETDYNICGYFARRAKYREKQGDLEQAEKDYDHAVEADEECIGCLHARAKFYQRRNRSEEALQDLNTLIELWEEDIDVYSLDDDGQYYKLRAEVYDKLNETEKAEADRQKAAGLRMAYEKEYGPVDEDEDEFAN